jgi:hypothetical protein
MFGEYAVRFSAAPISSGIAVNVFFKISRVIGFMVVVLYYTTNPLYTIEIIAEGY